MSNLQIMKGIQMFDEVHGSPSRSAGISEKQRCRGVQPQLLTNAVPPSPAQALSNLPRYISEEYTEAQFRRDDRNRYTYFAIAGARGLIKIGRSNDPWRRVSEIQSQVGCDVYIAATFRADVERRYQADFARLRAFGEWFWANTAILQEIDRLRAWERSQEKQCMIPPNERSAA